MCLIKNEVEGNQNECRQWKMNMQRKNRVFASIWDNKETGLHRAENI